MSKSHRYATTLTWTGNTGEGTANYRAYERAYEIAADGKPALLGSSDPSFRGDPGRWNPEELLLASISSLPPALVPAPVRRERRGGHRLSRRGHGGDGRGRDRRRPVRERRAAAARDDRGGLRPGQGHGPAPRRQRQVLRRQFAELPVEHEASVEVEAD
jgi:hypothetical protein